MDEEVEELLHRPLRPLLMRANAPNQVRLVPILSVQRLEERGDGQPPRMGNVNRLLMVVRDSEDPPVPNLNMYIRPNETVISRTPQPTQPTAAAQSTAPAAAEPTVPSTNPAPQNSVTSSIAARQKVPWEEFKTFNNNKRRRIDKQRALVKSMRASEKIRILEMRREKLTAAVMKGKLELEYLGVQLHGMESGDYPSTFGPIVRLQKQKLKDKLDQLKTLFEQFKDELAVYKKEKSGLKDLYGLSDSKKAPASAGDQL
ncbi:uncharacterized protein LOC135935674 [Cloeon dipterum]|uniref:uncharacterized protein LOC135935674 n=1 Tax=Cloeon dipterum TaxID=197152 RepID=UPI00321FD0B8